MSRKRYVFAPEAEQDLNEIKDYVTKEAGARIARQILKQIRDAVVFLSRTPEAGHSREDLTSSAVKFWAVYSYQIVYRYTSRPIEIVRIVHGSRDLSRLLSRDEE